MLGLLAGCASFPTFDAPGGAASSGISERYRLVAPLLSPGGGAADQALPMARRLAVRQVSNSSRAEATEASALDAGDAGTAWAPADGDAAPYAIFDLQDCGNLSGLTLRASDGVTVEVAVGSPDGWQVIASGLTPEANKLDWLPLRPTDAVQVRLLFSGPGVSRLRVSDVTWYGRRCGGDLPLFQPLPSRAPFHPPTDDPGSVFPRLTGTVTVKGALKTGQAFTPVLVDTGEPGVLDDIKLSVAGTVVFHKDLAGDAHGGGNIQLHKDQCE